MTSRAHELGHLALPGSAGPSPGVVLIHDVWGLYDHFRELADRLAAQGFATLAVDLYRRRTDVKIENPGAWIRALDDREVLGDVQAAADALRADPAVRAPRVGVTGFCMGGMYALLAAAGCERIDAAAPFYGLLSEEHGLLGGEGGPDRARKPTPPLVAAAHARCPLLGFFGDSDEFVPMADVEALRAALARSGEEAEVVVYPGAGHAFMNETRPAAYRPEAARDAWSRLIAFFDRSLRRRA